MVKRVLFLTAALLTMALAGCDPDGDGKSSVEVKAKESKEGVTASASEASAEATAAAEAKIAAEKAAAEQKAAEEKAKAEADAKEKSEALERDKALAEAKAKGEAAAKLEAEAKAKAVEAAQKAAEAAAKLAAEEKAKAEKKAEEDAKKAAEEEKAAKAEQEKKDAADKAERVENLKRISTRVFKLHHASAKEVADKFNSTWSGEFGDKYKVTKMAQAFEESNSVMVSAPNIILDACQRVIDEIDREAQQVYIEARFVELGNTASHKVGIDWSMLGGMSGTATLGGGIQSYVVGKGVQNYTREINSKSDGITKYSVSGASGSTGSGSSQSAWTGDSDGTISYFNGTLDFSQMSLTLKALDATQDAKTFSNPKIIVSSGKKATVDMTTKYPNVKISAKRTEASASTSLDIASNMEAIPGTDAMMFAKEAFFSWGISLDVTPRIGTNGLINVSIVPTISSLDSWVETGASDSSSGTVSSKYPIIKVQRLISEFNLESGTTAVIGGLSVTEENQVDNGIPVLRSIPWVGPRIFGSLERVKTQKEIIVFVTVGLVNPHRVEPGAGLPKNAILGRQYIKGQKLEPGDRPEKNMEGFDSLDMRPLEEQAKDPLKQQKTSFDFKDYIPFRKESDVKASKAGTDSEGSKQGH